MSRSPDLTVAAGRQAVSLLLDYPEQHLLDRLPTIAAAVAGLPPAVRTPLRRFLDHFESTPLPTLQQDFVATFDLRQRCCLYLSWWTHGDTRERGKALVRFKEIYRSAGLVPPDRELPDHLGVVLEFAALGDAEAGTALLEQHRPALELLHDALRKRQSPYALLVEAVQAMLPPAGPTVREAVRRIAAAGPPREQVGLEPYPTGEPR